MCLQRWPLGAWLYAGGIRHVHCTSGRHGVRISTRKPSKHLELSSSTPATATAEGDLTYSNTSHNHCPYSQSFNLDDYAIGTRIPSTQRDAPSSYGTSLNHRCQFCKRTTLKDANIFSQFQNPTVRDLWDIALFVHLVLVSAAVVSVVVSLCVRRTVCALHARTSLDTCTTASSHPQRSTIAISTSTGPVFLATVCLALAILTIATRCYASSSSTSTTTSSSHPSQTSSVAAHASTNRVERVVVQFSSQTLPSSIAQSQSSVSRDYFSSRRKSGRLKRQASSVDSSLLYGSSAGENLKKRDQITVVRTLVSNTTHVNNHTTTSTNSSSDSNITHSDSAVVRISERLRVNDSGPSAKHSTVRPMPPVHDQPTHTVTSDLGGGIEAGGGTGDSGGGGRQSFVALVISAALLTATLGLITCVVNYYRGGGTLPPGTTLQQHSLVPVLHHDQQQYVPVRESSTCSTGGANACFTPPTSAPMLSVVSASAAGMDGGGGGAASRLHRHVTRELAVQRDRQVRLHSVHTDLELDLPPSIALPDGEELPYGSSARLHIRDPEQESEIYQKCIRPPPNRTVFESESPPPYRSSSAGLLGSLGSSTSSNSTSGGGGGVGGGSSDWSGGSTAFVVRCHSMSSTSTTNKRTLDLQVATSSSASSAGGGGGGGQKTDFLQRTVKIFTGKKNTSQPPQPAPTLPVVVVPTSVRPTRRLAADPTAPARTKPQGNV